MTAVSLQTHSYEPDSFGPILQDSVHQHPKPLNSTARDVGRPYEYIHWRHESRPAIRDHKSKRSMRVVLTFRAPFRVPIILVPDPQNILGKEVPMWVSETSCL